MWNTLNSWIKLTFLGCCCAEIMCESEISCCWNCTAWFNFLTGCHGISCKRKQCSSKCKPTLIWSRLCASLASNCPTVQMQRATPWNKTALALTIPKRLSHFCSASAESRGSSSARQHLTYQGKKWHSIVIMQMRLHEKFKSQMTSPGVPVADRGRQRGTTWHSVENCESAVSACRLR